MIKSVKEMRNAPGLKSVSLHDGAVIGVTLADEIVILGHISLPGQLPLERKNESHSKKAGRPKGNPKVETPPVEERSENSVGAVLDA